MIDEVRKIYTTDELEATLENITKTITETCKSIPNTTHKERFTLPWWSETLAEMKEVTSRRPHPKTEGSGTVPATEREI